MRVLPAALQDARLKLATGLACLLPGSAFAAGSPFGVATPDAPGMGAVSGPAAPILLLAIQWQTYFYKQLTAALDQFALGGNAAFWLVFLSFVYGILHAVGPGHGKAVMSSYVMATGETLKSVVTLSVLASFLQAISAIVIIVVAVTILDATATEITRMTDQIEIVSYGLITLVGLAMVAARSRQFFSRGPKGIAGPTGATSAYACEGFVNGEPVGRRWSTMWHLLRHAEDCRCVEHIGLAYATRPRATIRERLATVASVGVRPCAGALIVLVFALSQGLALPGILSVFAMAAGTALTVSLVAVAAVFARAMVLRLAAPAQGTTRRVSAGLQLLAAAAVLLFGLTMEIGAMASAGMV
ncbi:hypothetical protein [Neorhizobium sp. NCHU2750]|uniref:nickel/cobalt transporter n=1 Tax=Neorhizobium sp. NCHU2750 TaxID=1825976 RepID=UPI000E70E839|nr:hypothetical protein NCHU2750_51320 [Neorhizobium sp. NCHU2750]